MKIAFYTLGCKVNQYETNAMAQMFLEQKNEIVDFGEFADVYIVNTCTVTSIADKKSRQMLRRAKQKNKDAIVVAVGCYTQTHADECSKIPEIDLILGNNEKNNIVQIVNEFINNKNNKIQVENIDNQKEFLDYGTVTYLEKIRAFIKVQDGCNNFCSYCLIPYARGRIRSRKSKSVIDEIKEIAKKGIKEVVITGINIAFYGKDFEDDYYLIDLLEDINKIDGIERIRLGSIEPIIITDEFVKRLSKLDKICNHFHLSLQSGCDETLKRMNRKYDTNEFLNCVNMLRNNFENVGLTADVIVGFPGETEEEFNKTVEFLNKIKFSKIHVFQYSPREGTRAAKMTEQIKSEIKEERSKKIIDISKKYEEEFLDNQIGKNLEVLFEQQENEFWKGHTKNYIIVQKKGKNLENKSLNVTIASRDSLELIAK